MDEKTWSSVPQHRTPNIDYYKCNVKRKLQIWAGVSPVGVQQQVIKATCIYDKHGKKKLQRPPEEKFSLRQDQQKRKQRWIVNKGHVKNNGSDMRSCT